MKYSYNLIIFVKNPIENQVKTRLARNIGEKKALLVYKKLLQKTYSVTKDIEVEKLVYYHNAIGINDFWDPKVYTKRLQKGEDLGEKMKNAFDQCFKKHCEKAVIIGSDCYEITKEIIEKAYIRLEENDIVIGPSFDGGYYLLGMKSLHSFLFNDMPWSEPHLLRLTLDRIQNNNKSLFLLEELNDIDTLEDLQKSKLGNLGEEFHIPD